MRIPKHATEIALVLFGCLLIAACLVLLRVANTRDVRILYLESQIVALNIVEQETNRGGLEIELPPAESQDSLLTFPIAGADYIVWTSAFGYRISPLLHIELYHTGTDLAAYPNAANIRAAREAQVVAARDGIVSVNYPVPGTPLPWPKEGVFDGHDIFGAYIEITHEDGMTTAYGHMGMTRVHEGDFVEAGEVIGRIGDTGKTTGKHLHFEIRTPDGTPQNPALYIDPH